MPVLAGVCRIETDVGHTLTALLLRSLGGGSSAVSLPSEERPSDSVGKGLSQSAANVWG